MSQPPSKTRLFVVISLVTVYFMFLATMRKGRFVGSRSGYRDRIWRASESILDANRTVGLAGTTFLARNTNKIEKGWREPDILGLANGTEELVLWPEQVGFPQPQEGQLHGEAEHVAEYFPGGPRGAEAHVPEVPENSTHPAEWPPLVNGSAHAADQGALVVG